MRRRVVGSFLSLLMTMSVAAKPVEIVLWHSLAGQLGVELTALTEGFNQSQRAYVLKPIYKGDYIESLTSFAAAFRAHQPPALVQVFEVGTATMLTPKGIIKPVDELLIEQGVVLPQQDFFPSVRAYYSENGQLMAMPLNISVPVLFYNRDALAQVGVSKTTFPTTWDELEKVAAKLQQAGFSCAYTTAYPAWILIEAYSAIHGLALTDEQATKAIYNHPPLVRHLERLKRWQQRHYFEYGGRSDDATILFTSGRCPILSQSSGSFNSLSTSVPFRVGMAALPLDTTVSLKRHNNVAGGAALWAMAGQSPTIYRGIAQFYSYLVQAKVQAHWHQQTGYLPLGGVGIYKQVALESQHPALAIAEAEWKNTTATTVVPLHIGAQNQIRTINDEALESLFAGIKTPQAAMDEAVSRANHAISRFKRNTSDE